MSGLSLAVWLIDPMPSEGMAFMPAQRVASLDLNNLHSHTVEGHGIPTGYNRGVQQRPDYMSWASLVTRYLALNPEVRS